MIKKMYDISVVIPAYNAEKYIRQCLNSVFGQKTTLSFEVICVDNASTDSTPEILDEYRINDNFRVIRKEINVGCYGARQAGLEEASGVYLLYLDSDDYLDENAFSILDKELNKNEGLDAIIFQYREFINETGETMRVCSHFDKTNVVITGEEAFLENDIPSMPWNRLLKIEVLRKHHIDYAKGMPDDVDFDFRHYPFLQRVILINKVLIHYRCIPNSTSRGVQAFVPYIEGFVEMVPRHLKLSNSFGSKRYWNKTFYRDFKDVYMYIAKYICYKGKKDKWLIHNLKSVDYTYEDILRCRYKGDRFFSRLKFIFKIRRPYLLLLTIMLKIRKR